METFVDSGGAVVVVVVVVVVLLAGSVAGRRWKARGGGERDDAERDEGEGGAPECSGEGHTSSVGTRGPPVEAASIRLDVDRPPARPDDRQGGEVEAVEGLGLTAGSGPDGGLRIATERAQDPLAGDRAGGARARDVEGRPARGVDVERQGERRAPGRGRVRRRRRGGG